MSTIKEKSLIEWKHAYTKENPADLGRSDCEICKFHNQSWKGHKWLQDQMQWPEQRKSDIEKKRLKKF